VSFKTIIKKKPEAKFCLGGNGIFLMFLNKMGIFVMALDGTYLKENVGKGGFH
jgi:hypothetical protein